MEQQLRDKILQAVDDGFDDQVAYLQTLVSFQSQRGAERPIQDFFFRDLAARGFAVDRFDMDETMLIAHEGGAPFSAEHSSAPIVVGTLYPRKETGHSLILQHHVDVVPVGPRDMWEHDPYGGEIVGSRLYGRGAGDMKAGASANVFALEALRRAGLRPAATVHLESVVEEESTGNGALQAFLQGYTAEAALVPEPEQETLVRAACGVLWFEVEVRGIPVHVHEMGEGANAIDAAYRVIGTLRELEAKWNAEAPEYEYFSGKQLPANLNIGKIAGGDWGSSVPAWCRFQVRVSIQPGLKAQDKFREIEEHVAAFARSDRFLAQHPPRLTQNGFNAEGYVLEPRSEAEKALAQAHEAAFGTPLETRIAPAYLDARVFALYHQIPVLCYGPKGYVSHGFDEYVDLESLRTTTKSMALFIADWCGTEPR
ncbi:ArgE/DapE family deacylase [Pseudodonghicola xiamenensis]|uniref:Acetylornithine deacetylase n=1 Tax=Pseudodonghicola xiamenensis TaxID=337702 RepID=A0A8J3H784_9RHOB|nr:ArgE/DapE family deacylase [Pseudodonghicola xiamenensis]GHG95503.1 acetylornithine deacetylase [Pseudodonghicola xiamenensis]